MRAAEVRRLLKRDLLTLTMITPLCCLCCPAGSSVAATPQAPGQFEAITKYGALETWSLKAWPFAAIDSGKSGAGSFANTTRTTDPMVVTRRILQGRQPHGSTTAFRWIYTRGLPVSAWLKLPESVSEFECVRRHFGAGVRFRLANGVVQTAYQHGPWRFDELDSDGRWGGGGTERHSSPAGS